MNNNTSLKRTKPLNGKIDPYFTNGQRTDSYLGTITNSVEGHLIVKLLSYLYRPIGRVTKKGRGKNRKELRTKVGLSNGKSIYEKVCPISVCEYFDVYLQRHSEVHNKPWNTERINYLTIPKYWSLNLGQLKQMVELQRVMKKTKDPLESKIDYKNITLEVNPRKLTGVC